MKSINSPICVECYVRTSSVVAPVDSTLRTLDRLETDGTIDTVTVDAWPATVRLGEPSPHSDVVDLFEEFDAWAEQWDVSIRPPFTVDTRTWEITGTTREVLTTPVQCLAIYANSSLQKVYPHTVSRADDDITYTVEHALGLLEEHDVPAFEIDQSPDISPNRRTVPDQDAP